MSLMQSSSTSEHSVCNNKKTVLREYMIVVLGRDPIAPDVTSEIESRSSRDDKKILQKKKKSTAKGSTRIDGDIVSASRDKSILRRPICPLQKLDGELCLWDLTAESLLADSLDTPKTSSPTPSPSKICNRFPSVGLANCVYLWNACTSKVTKLCDIRDDESVCSVSWTLRGTHLAIGTSSGTVEIWDALRCRRIRTMEGLRLRVGALAWSSSVLSSGSRDKSILQRDIRCQEDHVSKLTGHKSEVCGLKWSYDNRELASGGNDNKLLVWNQHSTQPVLRYCEHTAAFKAIAWSPHLHGLLASGGGTAYRCIRF
ncbi:unnamed protein product [Eruca vesicaria subsp. sativa]|uniref:CDC20/Fizzy WD40 domain-containing protein n=1 Tax=Eruca vesicaria subsp. sativa TaxID=29727 RepID=A0ABC8K6F2_ERUVS|nr:unnamed protein product [Eruca vesicaria subsp. sativa]